jgi:hypothetical protein
MKSMTIHPQITQIKKELSMFFYFDTETWQAGKAFCAEIHRAQRE